MQIVDKTTNVINIQRYEVERLAARGAQALRSPIEQLQIVKGCGFMVRQCAWCLCLIDCTGERLSPSPLPKLYEASHGICSVCGTLWIARATENHPGHGSVNRPEYQDQGQVGQPEYKEQGMSQTGTSPTVTTGTLPAI